MCRLKVSPAAPECGDDGSGHIWLYERLGQPVTWPNMHEIDSGGVVVAVVEVRPVDPAQPEQPVRVAGPHERAFVDISEPSDPPL
ncbi:MAG: hypothetical protein QOH60_1039 [Mycobacterium sp.]|jgi:hypothetical protein|nr:hypothetical protein [Mycobacterium sp.]